jgi:hypothetical protein
MGGGAFHLELDGNTVTPIVSVDSTGGWDVYQMASGTLTNLTPGNHTLRFVVDTSYFNIDWILFSVNTPSKIERVYNNSNNSKTMGVFDIYGKRVGNLPSDHTVPGVFIVRYESSRGIISEKIIVSSPK